MGKDKQKTLHSFSRDPFAEVKDDDSASTQFDAQAQADQPKPVVVNEEPSATQPVSLDQAQAVVPEWLAATIAKSAKPSAPTKSKIPKTPRPRKKTAERDLAIDANTVLETLIENIDATFEATPNLATLTPAESPIPARATGAIEQLIIFSMRGTDYATALSNVIEIERPPAVTSVPNMPDWVMGVTNLRGDIVSLVDLRAFLGIGQAGYLPTARVLMMQSRSAEVTIGMYVDQVVGVRSVPLDEIKPPTASIEDRLAPYLQGIYEHTGRMIVVLDFNKLLLSPEIRRFEIA